MNYWGPQDDDNDLPAWMDPKKCRQVNEEKEQRRKSGKDLNSVIQECLNKPAVRVIIDKPSE
jgi:hypothetical protein